MSYPETPFPCSRGKKEEVIRLQVGEKDETYPCHTTDEIPLQQRCVLGAA